MHVKNYTSAYISPATSGVILVISRRWELEPGREFFLSFSFNPLFSRFLSFIPDALFGTALTQKTRSACERRAFANASLYTMSY